MYMRLGAWERLVVGLLTRQQCLAPIPAGLLSDLEDVGDLPFWRSYFFLILGLEGVKILGGRGPSDM